MTIQRLIPVALAAFLAATTAASADCAEELARIEQDGSAVSESAGRTASAGDTGEGEDLQGGTFSAWGQETPTQTRQNDADSALQRAHAALDAGDEAGCREALGEASAR